eukprot:g3898.t1
MNSDGLLSVITRLIRFSGDRPKSSTHLPLSTFTLAKLLCLKTDAESIYPENNNALKCSQIDQWLEFGSDFDKQITNWFQPIETPPLRSSIKDSIIKGLAGIEQYLSSRKYLVGEELSLADIVLSFVLKPVFERIIGVQDQHSFQCIIRWMELIFTIPEIAQSTTLFKLNTSEESWRVMVTSEEEDPEKKAKKEAKAKAKEEKKLKALQKQQQQQQQMEKAKSECKTNNNSRAKSEKKSELEAKRKAVKEEIEQQTKLLKATPSGAKKDTSLPMLKGYHPPAVESVWYDWWDKCGFFKPQSQDNTQNHPKFVLVIPPPNVTGALHIGHALTNSVEDTIVRWKRMSGFNTLWVPGTDHAGIATQTVVEKMLMKEQGLTRHDIGREKFLETVYEWVGKYSNKIRDQLKRIGSSVDWSRKRFTLDEIMSRAVLEAFIKFHEKGMIYRENRLVNWCCTLRTALSDIEVEYIDVPGKTLLSVPGCDDKVEFGVLTSFAYPLESGDGEIVVATTRIETMLGDTAVAVHPDDPRYSHVHGKCVIHPVDGRKIPIITDAVLVDMEFGTGAVKITPAHDPNDYSTGKRHNLKFIIVIDDEGHINENGGPFHRQHRFIARKSVAKFLQDKGLFRGTETNPMRLGLCSRSGDVIEPALKPQWWVNCTEMAQKACQAVRDGSLTIIPKDFESTWFRWLENIRDWCISRQLWWGHRIPAYYLSFTDECPIDAGLPGRQSESSDRWFVARSKREAEEKARAKFPDKEFTLVQDEDVLDTWFSSGLFPFSVMGWPENTDDFTKYYPTSLLETGHDILFFWVARMVMMGITLTGEVPFSHVYLHSMVRDAHGRKMSKSLGNVIDPIHVIEGISLEGLHQTLEAGNLDAKEITKAREGQKADFPEGISECGADALRFALMSYTSQSGDINLDVKRVAAYRNWCNKLWNAIRFALINLPTDFLPATRLPIDKLPKSAQWILSRLSNASGEIVEGMEAYEFGNVTKILYAFWMDDLCDVYIELMKPVMALDETEQRNCEIKQFTREALWLCLDHGLRLLHPFMPFVTEELWQRLPRTEESKKEIPSIMISSYPQRNPDWINKELEEDVKYVNQLVTRTRRIRADYGLITSQKPVLFLRCKNRKVLQILNDFKSEIATLSYSSEVKVLTEDGEIPVGCSFLVFDSDTTIHLQLTGILDPNKEIEKLEKKLTDAQKSTSKLKEKMSRSNYAEKTPSNIQESDKSALEKKRAEIDSLVSSITVMEELKKSIS